MLADLAELPTHDAVASLACLDRNGLLGLAAAAVDLAGRWLARPRATDHEKMLRLTRMLLDALTDEPSPITALAWETVGGLEVRLGDAASAADAFGRAASVWAQFDVRQREDALVSAAFAHLLAGDDAEAAAALDTAGAKSLLVSAQGVLTAMTPRICNGKAALALRRGDLDDAATHVQAAFAGEHEAIFRDHGPEVLAEVSNSDRTGGARTLTLLQAAQLCFLRNDPEGEDIVADLLRRAIEDSAEETFLRQLFEDYPFHDFDTPAGTMSSRLDAALPSTDQ